MSAHFASAASHTIVSAPSSPDRVAPLLPMSDDEPQPLETFTRGEMRLPSGSAGSRAGRTLLAEIEELPR